MTRNLLLEKTCPHTSKILSHMLTLNLDTRANNIPIFFFEISLDNYLLNTPFM